jgi:hypothetical protein
MVSPQSCLTEVNRVDPEKTRELIPLHKSDFARANALAELEYPAAAPIVPDLLAWLQDSNWGIASVLSRILARMGAPLAPQIRNVLEGDDGQWKTSIIRGVIGASPELFDLLKADLERIANTPSPGERREGVDEDARDVLAEGRPEVTDTDPRIDPRQPDPRWRPR